MFGAVAVAKVAVPVVLVAAGVTAVVATPSARPAAAARHVWIDAPLGGTRLAVGEVPVLIHATGPDTVGAITLDVDGRRAGSTTALSTNGRLVSGTVRWSAGRGTHRLTAADGRGTVSVATTVIIGSGSPVASSTPTAVRPSGSPAISSRAATPTAPTRSIGATSASVPPSGAPSRTRGPSAPPAPSRTPSSPVSSTSTPDPPSVSGAALSSTTVFCGSPRARTTRVTASVDGAGSVTAVLSNDRFGTRRFTMAYGAGLYGVVIDSTELGVSSDDAVEFDVSVIATGEGGSVGRSAGTLTVVCQ